MGILGLLLLFSLPAVPGLGQKILSFFRETKISRLSAMAASIKQFSDGLGFRELLFANALAQLLFLWLFYTYAVVRPDYKAVVRLSILNCVFFTLLFLPATVVKKDTAADIQKILDENIVSGYPTPSLTASLADNSATGYGRFGEIGCLNMYNKKIGRVDYRISPCNLLSQNSFWFDTAFRNTILKYPLVYRADSLQPNRRSGDTASALSVLSFRPNRFVFASRSDGPGFYVLLQNYYPLWKLKIDGMERPIIKADISFMGFVVPAGEHTVEFQYTDRKLIFALWLNVLLTLVLLVLLFYQGLSKSSGTKV